MITRVLNARGEVTHDCRALGCEVSWDGYLLATGARAHVLSDVGTQPQPEGEPPATQEPSEPFVLPEHFEQVDEQTVRLKPAPVF